MDEFTDDVALAAGGWDPRFARVLAKTVVGDRAVTIIDSNGAACGEVYAYTEQLTWSAESGWRCDGGSNGDAGWTDGLAYATGFAEPGVTVVIE